MICLFQMKSLIHSPKILHILFFFHFSFFSVETLPFDCYEFLKMFYIVFRQSSGSVD